MDIFSALNRRYATRKFLKGVVLCKEEIDQLLEVVRMAPTAYGLQPFRILVVSDEDVKEQLRIFSNDKPQIVEAPHIFVFALVKDVSSAYLDDHIQIISKLRNVPIEALYLYKQELLSYIADNSSEYGVESWALSRAHIALGCLLLAAAEMAIDICTIEDINKEGYNTILNLDQEGLSAAFVCAIGHRDQEDPSAYFTKIRRSFQDMIAFI